MWPPVPLSLVEGRGVLVAVARRAVGGAVGIARVGVAVRAVAGLILGLGIGGLLTAVVVLTRFGPLVNTPRASHGGLLVLIFAIPAGAGFLIGILWRRLAHSRSAAGEHEPD